VTDQSGRRTAYAAALLLGVTAATTAVAGPAAAATPVGVWHMDETSGTVMRDAVRSHSGTLRNVALGLPGFLGKAYGFTTSDVTVHSAGDLNPGSANLTVTIRVKPNGAPAKPDWDLIRKGYYATSGGEWKVELQPSGRASCGFKGSGYVFLEAGPNQLNDGAWHTVVWEIYGDEMVATIDDQQMVLAKADGLSSDRNHLELNTGGGQWAQFKDVKVWKAELDDKWPAKRAQIINSLKKKADKLGYK